MADIIRLHSGEASALIARDDVYYAFGSGRLAYDCVTCGAKCCRGFSYSSNIGPELDRQIEMRRALPIFVRPGERNALQHVVGNVAPGCFFLTDDGRCEIHSGLGYDAKPETCRLFPFNNLRRFGRYLIVAPQPSLCPLAVVRDGAPSECSLYDELFAAMSTQELRGTVLQCAADGDADKVIALERVVVELAEKHIAQSNYLEFVREQIVAEQRAFPASERVALGSVEGVISLFKELFGGPQENELATDERLTQCMIAITPALRARMVFRANSGPDARPSERVARSRIPLAMLSLYLLAETARLAGMKSLTYQTLSSLEQEFRGLAFVLSSSDRVMQIGRSADVDPAAFEPASLRMLFVRLSRDLLAAGRERHEKTLGALFLAHAPADGLTRALFVRESAKRLWRVLVPVGQREAATGRRPLKARLGGSIHRWFLTHADDNALKAHYDRQYVKRTKEAAAPSL